MLTFRTPPGKSAEMSVAMNSPTYDTVREVYVTFCGISVTGATSNYYRVARAYAHAACTGGMLRRCFQDAMDCPPVQWVYVLDSGQRSSVTVNHPFSPPPLVRPGGVTEEDEPRENRTPCTLVARVDVLIRMYVQYTRLHMYVYV